jgi:8-oxo-dGTP diphosphatase
VSGSLIPCVGAVIKDGQGRLLLIKRGHEPGAGLWSLPGGRIEPGETDAEALVREMLEETGLAVEPGRLLGRVQRPGLGGSVIDIRDYAATVIGGTLRAGDDAADARWADAAELAKLAVTEGLLEALTEWGVLGPEQQLSSLFSICMLGALFVLPSDSPRFSFAAVSFGIAPALPTITAALPSRETTVGCRGRARTSSTTAVTAPVSVNRTYRMAAGPERVTIRLARRLAIRTVARLRPAPSSDSHSRAASSGTTLPPGRQRTPRPVLEPAAEAPSRSPSRQRTAALALPPAAEAPSCSPCRPSYPTRPASTSEILGSVFVCSYPPSGGG